MNRILSSALLVCSALTFSAACLSADDEADNGLITEWCELHPWDARCSTGEGGGGGTGGGGSSGGGGGNCVPGDIGCHGPVNCRAGFRWNSVTRRCEYQNVGEICSLYPGDQCIRDILGYCQCPVPEGPLFTRESTDD
jgi:hypothetical protein